MCAVNQLDRKIPIACGPWDFCSQQAAINTKEKIMKFKVTAFIPDMGSYTTVATESNSETKEENALWDFNSARRHDGLPEFTIEQFLKLIDSKNVKFSPLT